jgi:uncharacterized damage-inducible protein DinB
MTTMMDLLRRHLQPALDMLANAVKACPDDVWDAADGTAPIWQQAYHTLFWLEAWLPCWGHEVERPAFHTDEALNLTRGASPVITRRQMEGYMEQVYSELESYLDSIPVESLTEETTAFGQTWTVADRILTQIRHVQHHVGSMHSILKRRTGRAPEWLGYNE